MRNRILPGLILSASIACAGVANAQTAPNNGSKPMTMPMAGAMSNMAPSDRPTGASFTPGEIATIGVGVVVGAVLFQGAMWHGMTIVGAALGGWVGDYLYNVHTGEKSPT